MCGAGGVRGVKANAGHTKPAAGACGGRRVRRRPNPPEDAEAPSGAPPAEDASGAPNPPEAAAGGEPRDPGADADEAAAEPAL